MFRNSSSPSTLRISQSCTLLCRAAISSSVTLGALALHASHCCSASPLMLNLQANIWFFAIATELTWSQLSILSTNFLKLDALQNTVYLNSIPRLHHERAS